MTDITIDNIQSFLQTNKTDLCDIMNKYGSDKGNGHHNYTLVYTHLFDNIKNNRMNIFELGLGTNNININSHMGINGKPGASLYGWREYFKNSTIYGADIDRDILFNSERINTFFCDQTDKESIKNLWDECNIMFDIIIEDGLHTFDGHYTFLTNSIHKVKKGGYYISEDLMPQSVDMFQNILPLLKKNFNLESITILKIPNKGKNETDNTLLIIKV